MKLNILFTCLLIECACGLSISPYRVMGDVETLYRCCHDVTPCVHEIYHDREYCRSSDNRHCAVVLASEQQYELLKRSWTTESLTQEMTTKVENVKRMLAMESSRSLSESEWYHHDYQSMVAVLRNITETYPTLARMMSIGKTVHDRDMWVIVISNNVSSAPRPGVRLAANIHGDEVVGKELLIKLASYLCDNYGTNTRITRMVDNTVIYIVPSVNPDGYATHDRWNAHYRDLNRNFPDQFIGDTGTYEPETSNMMTFMKSDDRVVLSATMHGGAVVANYPWDGRPDGREDAGKYCGAPDDALFKYLAKTYAKTHKSMSKSAEFPYGITNGAYWYPLYGGMQDWPYLHAQDNELTLELSEVKWPSAGELPEYWYQNSEALLTYIELANTGLHGYVIDNNQQPVVECVISIFGIAHNVTSKDKGDYRRLLAPGSYTVTFSKDGFKNHQASVVIVDRNVTILNVKLVPFNDTDDNDDDDDDQHVHDDDGDLQMPVYVYYATGAVISSMVIGGVACYFNKNARSRGFVRWRDSEAQGGGGGCCGLCGHRDSRVVELDLDPFSLDNELDNDADNDVDI